MIPNKLVTLTVFQQLALAKMTQNRLNEKLDETELTQQRSDSINHLYQPFRVSV